MPTDALPRKLYAIMRFAKIRSFAALARVCAHNIRTIVGENIVEGAPEPIELLEHGTDDFVASAHALLNRMGIDPASIKNKVLAVEAVTTASKGWFEKATDDEKRQWIAANLEWGRRKFGEGLISARLHLDEETWHIHTVALPVVEKRAAQRGAPPRDPAARAEYERRKATAPMRWTVSYHDVLGGPKKRFSSEQDAYHQAVEHLGLERGEVQREDIEIEIGDELTISALALSRGIDANGVRRPRRNMTPAQGRAEVKRLRREAEAARRSVEQVQRRAEEHRREARAALAETVSARDAVKASRAEAEQDRQAAVALLTAADAERQSLVEQKALHQDQLALLVRASDAQSGLDLRATDKSFVMRVEAMTDAERTTYRHPWPQALIALARRIALTLERARVRAAQLLSREQAVAAREIEAETVRASHEAAARDLEARRAVQRGQHEQALAAITHREAIALGAERQAANTVASAEARIATAAVKQAEAEAAVQDQREWQKAVTLIVKHPELVLIDGDGAMRIDPLAARAMPPWLLATLDRPAPAWAVSIVTLQRQLAESVERADDRERQAIYSADRLEDVVRRAGPALTPAQRAVATEAKRVLRQFDPRRQRGRDGPGL